MPSVIQRSDFYTANSVLHPLVVGSILLIVVYVWVRLTSARSFSGMTVFSMLLNLTLGSTMSRIITQPDLNLTRGLISVAVICGFEFFSDWIAAHSKWVAKLIGKESVLLVFRGEIDVKVLKEHRMIESAIWSALRMKGYTKLSQVEAVVLEMSGALSIIGALDNPETDEAPALDRVEGYTQRREAWLQRKNKEPPLPRDSAATQV